MPAKRKRKSISSNRKKFKKKYLYYLFFIIILIIGLFVVLRTNKWNGKDKLSLVIKNNDYSLNIIVFDPELEEIYNLKIPENTEIKVAGDLGIWKIKSLWGLGDQEGQGGKLAARSITVGLQLPVYAWAEEQALGLANPNIKLSLIALFSSYKSNLIFGDKLRMLIFSTKVKNSKRVTINLSDTNFLEKRVLSDGEEGYVVAQKPPQNILAIFSEPILSAGITRVSIKDSTEKAGLAENVGRIIEVLGGKITSVQTTKDFDGVCILESKKEKVLEILLKIFECEESNVKPDQSFDVEITLGRKFSSKY